MRYTETTPSSYQVETVRQGTGKLVDRGTVKYPKYFLYLPKNVVEDGTFPFTVGDKLQVKIDDGQLIIKKSSATQN